MDKAEEDQWAGILRNREAELWPTYVHCSCGIDCFGYLKGHYTGVRLQSKSEIDCWTRNKR